MRTYTYMTKTISLSDDAYKLLRNMKLKDESFSDVIKRLTKKKATLSEILDLHSELREVSEYENSVKKIRAKLDEEFKQGFAL
ncbi:MAG: hypothetical protein HY929_04385 [Euryarchaeota archaeon]|nr:hypothetical protein [Euryarchaeota archaeon]